jgi:hypothetical protein
MEDAAPEVSRVWRAFAYRMREGVAPFVGVHLVDTTIMRPVCSDELGELQPARGVAGYVLTCTKCLEIAEWELNYGARDHQRKRVREARAVPRKRRAAARTS